MSVADADDEYTKNQWQDEYFQWYDYHASSLAHRPSSLLFAMRWLFVTCAH